MQMGPGVLEYRRTPFLCNFSLSTSFCSGNELLSTKIINSCGMRIDRKYGTGNTAFSNYDFILMIIRG